MPIPLPNLDDRTYAELTAEAQALIPSLHPAWTNHNPSDPGVVLVELLAWLSEMLLFQVNEIPAANTEKFLKLLNGKDWVRPPHLSQPAVIRQTMLAVRERYRAVTPADYEYLALHRWPQSDAAKPLNGAAKIRRVRCVPGRNLAASDLALRQAPAPAHVSLVVVPEPAANETSPQPTEPLRNALWAFLEERRTLTTRHHVVGPEYVAIRVSANLALHEDAPPAATLAAARAALAAFFHPLTGGLEGNGWPFGRAIYVSELYAVLEQTQLVNYVEDVQVTTPLGDSRRLFEEQTVVGIWLDDHELVQLETPTLVGYDVYGKRYE